jgi:GTP:adenosylcobinamide-phosphate guanylyltransferase
MKQIPLHVIVQAGGRGSRLRHHTWNKPKCLVSVLGKPILYHLFDQFRHAKFLIIGDYLFSQLQSYLEINPPGVEFDLIQTHEKGTASGIDVALGLMPPNAHVLITWSDLLLKETPSFDHVDSPVVITTDAFTCRWTAAESGVLRELPGTSNGIPGLFYLPRADCLPPPPKQGEFVKWFSQNVPRFHLQKFNGIEEFGDFATIEAGNERSGFCRFFNRVDIDQAAGKVTKTVIDKDYLSVHRDEVSWYREAQNLGFRRIPRIYSEEPLVLERIRGIHAYHGFDFSKREQRAVLADHLDALFSLHDLGSIQSSESDLRTVYIDKTKARVASIAKLIPMFSRDSITINGRKCRNIFVEKHHDCFDKIQKTLHTDSFVPIHGDPTFSNSIVDDKLRVWFIDPRGYFAKQGIFGDANYDFAKVYYSAVGGYDAFNRRKFKLYVDDDTVEVLMDTPLFAETAKSIFKETFGENQHRIELLHGLIWLGLSGYVRDDIDSAIGAFYLGLYWLEEGLANL